MPRNIQQAVSTSRPSFRRTSALIYIPPRFLSLQTHQILPDTQSFPDKRHSFRAQSTAVSSLIPIFQSHSKHAIMQMHYTFIAITYNLPSVPAEAPPTGSLSCLIYARSPPFDPRSVYAAPDATLSSPRKVTREHRVIYDESSSAWGARGRRRLSSFPQSART